MAKATKKEIEKLRRDLTDQRPLIWDELTAKQERDLTALSEEYKKFLDECRTERLAARWIADRARKAGFVEEGGRGDKVLITHRDKVVALGWLGKRPLKEGIRLIGSHIDCPRLDLKTKPVFENEQITFLKTQYYGGIRKYQWLARPLALVGPVFKTDGSRVDISIGLKPDDPVFTVSDLLPHLARKAQSEKKLSEAFEGEKLNVIIGTRPLVGDEIKERFKLAVLKHIFDAYGLTESDFISAELEVVPADPARDVGFDRALIGAYGHDDRVSAFASYKAAMDIVSAKGKPVRPGLVIMLDKEETGSDGNTGAKSRFMWHAVAQLLLAAGLEPNSYQIQQTLFNSYAVSADVTAVYDPDFPEVHEKRNAAFFGYGPCVTKYGGSGGKYSTSDANAEFMGWVRRTLDGAKVAWQPAGLYKVDEGGGGTIAKFMAEHGMEVVDMGTPVLGMHSPFELISKADLYMTRLAFTAFLKAD